MGITLIIHTKPNGKGTFLFDAGKLYGYCEPQRLRSFWYLVDIGKVNKWATFDHDAPEIELDHHELQEFFKLYAEDFKTIWIKDDFLEMYGEELEKLFEYKEKVYLNWW